MIGLALFVLVVFVTIVIIMTIRSPKSSSSYHLDMKHHKFSKKVDISYDIEANIETVEVQQMAVELDIWQIPNGKLTIENVKEYGSFTEICYGTLETRGQATPVFIKKLRDTLSSSDQNKLKAELEIVSRVAYHENLLNLIGTISQDQLKLVFEYCELGRLDQWLSSLHEAHQPLLQHSPQFNILSALLPHVLQIASDIAQGMAHLAEMKCTSHSLGARNIMLSKNLVAKVCDYGMAAYSDENIFAGAKVVHSSPYSRWMAYETLLYSSYSEKSNIWTFGIILWEILMFGEKPYPDIQLEKLRIYLKEGHRPAKLHYFPDYLCSLMSECWKLQPKERPTFEFINSTLDKHYSNLSLQNVANRRNTFEKLSLIGSSGDHLTISHIKQLEYLTSCSIQNSFLTSRLMAVQYAATVFPGNHVPSKFVLLQACGDENDVIRTEALNILRANTKVSEVDISMSQPKGTCMPSFTDMALYLRSKASDAMSSPKLKSQGPLGTFTIPFHPKAFEKISVYLRMCLAYSAGVTPNVNTIEEMQKQGPALHSYIGGVLQTYSGSPDNPIDTYLGLLRQYVSAIGGGSAMLRLLELASVAPNKVGSEFAGKTKHLKALVESPDAEMRQYAAEMYGIVACYMERPSLKEDIKHFIHSLDHDNYATQHGSVLVLGHILRKLIEKEKHGGKVHIQKNRDSLDIVEDDIYNDAMKAIGIMLENQSEDLVAAGCHAIADVASCGSLPISSESNGSFKAKSTSVSKHYIVKQLTCLINTENNKLNVKKNAAKALSSLVIGEKNFVYKEVVIEALKKTIEIKAEKLTEHIELHFELADAFASAVQGNTCPSGCDQWLEVTLKDGLGKVVNENLSECIDSLFSAHRSSENEKLHEAICVWLLVFVEIFHRRDVIQSRFQKLREIITLKVQQWDVSKEIQYLSEPTQSRLLTALKALKPAED